VVDQKKARPIRIKVQDYKNWARLAKAGDQSKLWPGVNKIKHAADLLLNYEPQLGLLYDAIGVPDDLAHIALVAGGAVRKELLPVGALEKKSVFSLFL